MNSAWRTWTQYWRRLPEFWHVNWMPVEFPCPQFIFRKNFFTKPHMCSSAEIYIYENCILFKSDSGNVAIPNDPKICEMLHELSLQAKKIQKRMPEEERVQSIKDFKKRGYMNIHETEQPLSTPPVE